MFGDTYPHLKAKYNVDNFEIIAAAIDTHFSDIFKLDALESAATSGGAPGSYMAFFDACMTRLNGLYTVDEVVNALHLCLQKDESIRNQFLNQLIFVPNVGNKPSKQIGFIEKMATDSLNMAEPVSYIDMIRAVNGLKHHKKSVSSLSTAFPSVSVVHLHDLSMLDVNQLKRENQALFVNFNRDLKGAPKWGVIDLRNKANLTAYCETPLTESEKALLEKNLGVQMGEFIGAGANSLPSTGYTALAWLDNNITHAWNFNIDGDFSALMQAYAFAEFGGDVPGMSYSIHPHEINQFCTPAFRNIANQAFLDMGGRGIESNVFSGGRPLTFISYAAVLGQCGDSRFRPGDIGAVINIFESKGLKTHDQVKPFFRKSASTSPPGFSRTLSVHIPKLLIEDEDGSSMFLKIPDILDIDRINDTHVKNCRETNTSSDWLRGLPTTVPRAGTKAEYLAAIMVMTLVRCKAKKRILKIDLPEKYQLNREEQAFVVATLSENAYVSEFECNHNLSLEWVHTELTPILARNRWLAASGYRPPMIDDYWKQAAKYWLLHLNNTPQVLLPKEENALFKRCVAEMGMMGLESVLAFLRDETERELIERVYGRNLPPFFAACPSKDIKPYLTALITHLREDAYFPFSELGISYQPGNDEAFIELLGQINKLERFEKITLTDCLVNKAAFGEFLNKLTRQAHAKKWVGLIVIPELEDKNNTSEDIRVLRAMYAQLNNVILKNRHLILANALIKRIKETSDFSEDVLLPEEEAVVGDEEEAIGAEGLEGAVQNALTRLGDATYPLKRGGVVQLQLQQQQQIEQVRQIQQHQQKVRAQVLEEAITEQLVNFTNIDKVMGKYFTAYCKENRLYESGALLKQGTDSELQGFFRTWVNANVGVNARHVIHDMTLDAAKMLLRKHRMLPSGLNPENLPKGFYTQRSKDGHLILCYSAELGYLIPPNPFTLDLDTRIPEAELWEGDFRQFDIERYMGGVRPLEEEDWQYMQLFTFMQPAKDYKSDYDRFCQQNPRIVALKGFRGQERKITTHWLTFLQAWQYGGVDGVSDFLARPESALTLPIATIQEILLKHQTPALQDWASQYSLSLHEDYLRALGQVYYRNGDEGVSVLLAKLRQISDNLGDDFYVHFAQYVLKNSRNFNCFMSETFFTAMDDMIAKLRPAQAAANKQAWQVVMSKHMAAIGWESIEKLWMGFDHFVSELTQMGLELEGNEFDDVNPEHMLVAMDRILDSLRMIPQFEGQQAFLQHLAHMDKTHGGVHYALQHEGFKYFNSELELHDFVGDETYAPDLLALYQWRGDDASLKMKRALASKARFSHATYLLLSEQLGNEEMSSRHLLMWFLHMQYPSTDIEGIWHKVAGISARTQELIARHMHRVVYEHGHPYVSVHLEAMVDFDAYLTVRGALDIATLLDRYPHGTLLEALSILWQSKRFSDANVDGLLKLFEAPRAKEANYPEHLYREGYKLAILFGMNGDGLNAFYQATKGILPVVQNELRKLIVQLLSVDYNPATSNVQALIEPDNWARLLTCIEEMKAHPANTSEARVAYIDRLTAKGIVFKYSKHGDFRALKDKTEDVIEGLGFFVDHEDRLWEFLHAHIAVPVEGDANDAVKPIIRFLKVLQLNRTYLNEIEPLLASLEKTGPGLYWSASYFYGLLRALQPEDDKTSFPISLLKIVLQEGLVGAKALDGVEKEFPKELSESLQRILKGTAFSRVEQAMLCQIALREFDWQGSSLLLNKIMTTLGSDGFTAGRGHALDILSKCKNVHELEKQFDNCCWLLQSKSANVSVSSCWSKTSALWLKALSMRESEMSLFERIQSDELSHDAEKQGLILHIIAWSSLSPGLRDMESYEYELSKKAPKLVSRLSAMDVSDLTLLAACYPGEPSPRADDLVRMIKQKKVDETVSWSELIDVYMRHPYPEPRADYGQIALTRDADLQRMIAETQVSRGSARTVVSAKQAAELTLIFAYLKRLESGEVKIGGERPISDMSRDDLATVFRELSGASRKQPENYLIRAQIWAVLFEVLGRTTRKYPHLAQQFALIANDVCLEANSRVLQLATGEGKSHYVAMRAARHAGMGKVVDVCTAKRTLAERDLADYQGFFDYLHLTTSYIHPKSSRESYVESQIHYSTTGDLSLFLDDQSYNGQPIEIPREERVALFDEFDFIRDDEGRKTQYNYARPTGKTPKQMTWFYQVVNDFYNKSKADGVIDNSLPRPLTKQVLKLFAERLLHEVGDNEEKQSIVAGLIRDPLQLVQCLQSAHEAHELTRGIGFTVREEEIHVGEESYPMREVIPLSTDNQKMVGSTFSAGVHQLLAVRLNKEAKEKGEPQNFHIHPESHIISSQIAAQRMHELWSSWEGFSGTISPAQAEMLHDEVGTEVLHVPTNRRDLRLWHKPLFYGKDGVKTDVEKRLDAIVKQIRTCLEKKQSILFSCKNDKQVQELEEQLKKRLTSDELKQFIFYTNEEQRGASEVLSDKQEMEEWHGGRKQKGIVLVASGFGRGDNVGVEAVFLLNVNDTNDLLQKGGRTARNGEEGEVFQFYLSEELRVEEGYLLDVLAASEQDVNMGTIRGELTKVQEEGDSGLFRRVMLLREYVFNLQNAANQGYHHAVAELSSWGMRLLGSVPDPTLRQELTLFFSNQHRRLEKQWVRISSDAKTGVQEKIAVIKQAIMAEAQQFVGRYANGIGQDEGAVPAFRFAPMGESRIKLVVLDKPKPTKRDKAIASICSVLTRLSDLQLKDPRIAEVPRFLSVLAGDVTLEEDGARIDNANERLQKFAGKIAKCHSMKEFMDRLEVYCEQALHPSEAWEEVSTSAEEEIEPSHLLKQTMGVLRTETAGAMDTLLPPLQTQIVHTLCASNLLSVEDRVRQALPIIQHLGKFSPNEQRQWGSEYIEQLSQIVHETPLELLVARLEKSKPMSYSHFNRLWLLGRHASSNAAELGEVLALLCDVTAPGPDRRLRMLTEWEALAGHLNPKEAHDFLVSYCQVMKGFEEGRDWDGFENLIQKTHEWWNKGGAHSYQKDLLAIWQKLAHTYQTIKKKNQEQFNSFVKWTTEQHGKEWFQVLDKSLVLPMDLLCAHHHQLGILWHAIDNNSDIKKAAKFEEFTECLNGLITFDDAMNLLGKSLASKLRSKLEGLEGGQFMRMLLVIQEHKNLLVAQPNVLLAIMNHMSDPNISLPCIDGLNHVLLQIASFAERHPDKSITHLLEGVERFKNDEAGLSILQAFYSKNNEHLEEPLFDQSVEYLKRYADEDARSDAIDVIEMFYDAVEKSANHPQAMMALPSVRRLFEFEDRTEKTRNQRIFLMHLLNEHTLETLDNPGDYEWKVEMNDDVLKLGFKHYLDNTQHILDKSVGVAEKVPDLTSVQQHALLHLTDELKLIGQGQFTKSPVMNFAADLYKIASSYQASWFKSQERQDQSKELQEKIRLILMNKGNNHYEAVLQAIHQAKLIAMASDLEQNKERIFKLNRTGSRYFNTLNQMHDMVLRHWTKDLGALQSLQLYQTFHHQQFKDLSVAMLAELKMYRQEVEERADYVKDSSFLKGWDSFFGKGPDLREKIVKLDDLMRALVNKGADTFNAHEISELVKALQIAVPKLPGYLVTLSNELLARGEAFVSHLEEHGDVVRTGKRMIGE